MTIRIDSIRECLDGIIPGTIATCSAEGVPNVTVLSQVEYVDDEHVATSYQFFNKTRANILQNPHAQVLVIHPLTAERYRILMQYLRTETSGPVFERMKAKLAGIASHSGMADVFKLRGSDIYRVLEVERVKGKSLMPQPARNRLSALRMASERIRGCADLETLFQETLATLEQTFGIRNSMLLMLDGPNGKLYAVASLGYEQSGVGSEIAVGDGVIGVSARERTPIRIGYWSAEYSYAQAIRRHIEADGMSVILEREIPLPGLKDSRSQIAVPIMAMGRLLGVLFAESSEDLRFGYDDEDALVSLAGQLGVAIHAMQEMSENEPEEPPRGGGVGGARQRSLKAKEHNGGLASRSGSPLLVRHYPEDDTVFLGDDYLIKGVAGNILWALLCDYSEKKRTAFSNRELRLDPRIQLPDIGDNLEARLVLLRRRLAERTGDIQIEKTARGRFSMAVTRPLELVQIRAGAGR